MDFSFRAAILARWLSCFDSTWYKAVRPAGNPPAGRTADLSWDSTSVVLLQWNYKSTLSTDRKFYLSWGITSPAQSCLSSVSQLLDPQTQRGSLLVWVPPPTASLKGSQVSRLCIMFSLNRKSFQLLFGLQHKNWPRHLNNDNYDNNNKKPD